MTPHLLPGIEVPSLQFTDVIGVRRQEESGHSSSIALPWRVGDRLTRHRAAQIVIGWDIEQPRLWTVSHWRPILAAPQ